MMKIKYGLQKNDIGKYIEYSSKAWADYPGGNIEGQRERKRSCDEGQTVRLLAL